MRVWAPTAAVIPCLKLAPLKISLFGLSFRPLAGLHRRSTGTLPGTGVAVGVGVTGVGGVPVGRGVTVAVGATEGAKMPCGPGPVGSVRWQTVHVSSVPA